MADFLRLEALIPTTSFVWHWVKGPSKENSRDARGNERSDKLADIKAEEAKLRSRMPDATSTAGTGATEPGPMRSRSLSTNVDLDFNFLTEPSTLDIPSSGSTLPTLGVG